MALTKSEKQELLDVIDRTGGNREVMFAQRVIPQWYKDYMDMVDREELMLDLPGTVAPVRCIVSKARNRAPGCIVHVNMHGGGFVLPQNEDDDRYCARLAHELGGVVVDIDYATTRDYPWPAALDQSYAVVKWAFSMCSEWDGDVKRVSVGGHSAGGTLASAISLKAAQTGDFKLCAQVVDYAANDNYMSLLPGGLERSRAFSLLYSDGDTELLKQPLVSPGYADVEMLKNHPRTIIVEPARCPFRDTNRQYGMKLISAGNEVVFYGLPDSAHGATVRLLGEWEKAQECIIRELKNCALK